VRLSAKEIFTIPNCLSILRIILLPIFVIFYIQAKEPEDYLLPTLIIFISAISDLLDGFIARTFNQVTELGKAIDPVADKLQQAAIVFCLLFRYDQMIPLVILFVVKELFMGINGLILLRKGKKLDGAMWFGKVSTAVFYLCMLSLLAFPNLEEKWVNLFISITGFFLALSFLLYIPVYVKLYQQPK